jgi:hypothetical protein
MPFGFPRRRLLGVCATVVWLAGCASGPAPMVPPARSAHTEPAATSSPGTPSPAARTDTITPPLSASGAPTETPPTDTRRLAWVNPSRCLSPCAFHPGDALVRVNDGAVDDPRGGFRVDSTALVALRALLTAARVAGHKIRISSAFRSYDEQARLFRTTKDKGRAARPGHSEHQLGTTIDLHLPTTRAIDWLAEHVAAHGFALSYPPGKQRTTGYRPEPWHVRFVGHDIAARVPVGGTLEDLFRRHPDLAESGDCADCPASASRAECGALTVGGTCEGSVLNWCFDGARNAIDCAAFGHTCGNSGAVADCVPAHTSVPAR